jgi:hypothetical protein
MADEECQTFQHSDQWMETIDPSISALQVNLLATTKESTAADNTLYINISLRQYQSSSTSNTKDYQPLLISVPKRPILILLYMMIK